MNLFVAERHRMVAVGFSPRIWSESESVSRSATGYCWGMGNPKAGILCHYVARWVRVKHTVD